MDMGFYFRDKKLWDYFITLPAPVRDQLLRHNVQVCSLGELQTIAEHFRQELQDP